MFPLIAEGVGLDSF